MIVCGIMTGTSLDAIDIAVCEFGENPSLDNDFELLYFFECPFPSLLHSDLQRIITNGACTLKELSQINISYTKAIAEAILHSCRLNNFDNKKINLIGLHGQTLWHNPLIESSSGFDVCSTFQLGSGSALASMLSTTVVFDFRTADMALGGQGAPLVPLFDYHFLRSRSVDRVILNIGGISNISYLPKNCSENQVSAFDVGPGNTLLDLTTRKYFELDFDKDGELSRRGKLLSEKFELLKNDTFVNTQPPKSTGREYYNAEFVNNIFNQSDSGFDVLHTLAHFTAYAISQNIKLYCGNTSEIIISGGGVKNKFLLELIKQYNPSSTLKLSDEIGIAGDAKEAIAFAFLAWRRINSLYGNLPSVTGAKRKELLGSISGHYIK